MSILTENHILDALKKVIDPSANKDIVSLGIVKNININDGKITLDLASASPAREIYQRKSEEALIALEGVKTVKVNLEVAGQVKHQAVIPSLAKVKHIIAVSSCKGGVGKSTVCSLLAYNLSLKGKKVGLVDTDIHGPSIPSLFNIHNPKITTNERNQLYPIVKDNLKIMSFGFLLGDGPAVMRGPIVTRYVQEVLINTEWGELDYLFIDLPPGTGDVQLTITQILRLDGAIIVTTPQTLSLVDVARGIIMFEKVNVPILGIVENMAYFVCDGCDKKHRIFGHHSHDYFESRFGISTIGELPITSALTKDIERFNDDTEISEIIDKIITSIEKMKVKKKNVPDIQYNGENIKLIQEDSKELIVSHKKLRLNCPCAVCVDEMSGKRMIDEGSIRQDIAPKSIIPLGNYAIAVTWNDGHSSGIYPYSLLINLSK